MGPTAQKVFLTENGDLEKILGNGISLHIPADAVTSDVIFGVQTRVHNAIERDMYLYPAIKFAQNVTLSIQFDIDKLPVGKTLADY